MALESSGMILYVAEISYQSHNQYGNCQGGPKLYTDTHTDTHTHTDTQTHTDTHTDTHRQTHTHTHTGCPFYKSFYFQERNKTKNERHVNKNWVDKDSAKYK